jgi:hypothetical protein
MPAPRRRRCPSNASATMAMMPKRCWQQCQRDNNASTATTTVGRHGPRQRNACQQDVGDDTSGDFSKDGEFVEDNNFSTKGNLAEDGSLAKEGNFDAVGDFCQRSATMPKQHWQRCQRDDGTRASTTEGCSAGSAYDTTMAAAATKATTSLQCLPAGFWK